MRSLQKHKIYANNSSLLAIKGEFGDFVGEVNWYGESRVRNIGLGFENKEKFHLQGRIHSKPDTDDKSKILGNNLMSDYQLIITN